MGAFIAHMLYLTFYSQHAPLGIYLTGAIIGALPDLDLLKPLQSKATLDLTHRNTIFHQPILLLSIPAILLILISPFWALLWALPLLWHYLHDTFGESMGVQWLFPFSRKKYSFYDVDETGKRQFFVARPEGFPGMTLDEALQKKFYRLTPTSIIEAILPLIFLLVIALTW